MKLVDSNDSIIFFAETISLKQHRELFKQLGGISEKVYFVLENNKNNIPTIDHKRWITLINNHKRSFTWK